MVKIGVCCHPKERIALFLIILDRLNAVLDGCLSEQQARFRKGRSTLQQILTLCLTAEKYLERSNCFVGYTIASTQYGMMGSGQSSVVFEILRN